jgi:hypothetical protein
VFSLALACRLRLDGSGSGGKESMKAVSASDWFEASHTALRSVLSVELPDEIVAQVDDWADFHHVTRAEAARRLVELGLKVGKA